MIGTVLLKLPGSTTGPGVSWLDALFEATSAVTVTGLQVAPPPGNFTVFGQGILAVLIQAGGLGIITATTIGMVLIGGHLGFRGLMAAGEEASLPGGPGDLLRLARNIALATFALELAGAAVLTVYLVATGWDLPAALGQAVFHSISAFCNAGFSTFSEGLSTYAGSLTVNVVFVSLIVAGGLGFPVLVNLYRYPRVRRLSLHSKLVLTMYAILLPAGILTFAALEWNHAETLGGEPLLTRVLESLFQGVTPRTAGFSTVTYSDLYDSTLVTQIVLMFIGAAPASTGGGVKVTTVALAFLLLKAQMRGWEDITAFDRWVPPHLLYKTLAVLFVAAALVISGAVAIMISDGWDFLTALFHTTSALGTVGLNVRPSSELGTFGRLLLIFLMLVGRLGPITLLLALSARSRPRPYTYPEETIAVG